MACIALWMRLVHTWFSSPTYAEIGGNAPNDRLHINAILSILQLMREDDQRVLDARRARRRARAALRPAVSSASARRRCGGSRRSRCGSSRRCAPGTRARAGSRPAAPGSCRRRAPRSSGAIALADRCRPRPAAPPPRRRPSSSPAAPSAAAPAGAPRSTSSSGADIISGTRPSTSSK